MEQAKQYGVTYTPDKLGMFMAKLLLDVSNEYNVKINSILDPSVGDGDLLISASKFFKDVCFEGMDIDPETISRARNNFMHLGINNYDLKVGNYLNNQPSLFDEFEEDSNNIKDSIIANPPYVRTQNMDYETRKIISDYAIEGKVDLYQAFILEMTRQLKDGGSICMITSNRYMTTNSGKSTREFLRSNYKIIEVIDLGDTKLFDASVLPSIFVGIKMKNANNERVKFKKIYELSNKKIIHDRVFDDVFESLEYVENDNVIAKINDKDYNVEDGTMLLPEKITDPWTLSSVDKIEWANSLSRNNFKFEDVFNLHVGIKTTADKVFIRNDWSNQINCDETSLIHPMISSRIITKWSSKRMKNFKFILYPYELKNDEMNPIDLSKYAHTSMYLNYFYNRLSSRKYLIKANRKWYEIWVPQNPFIMKKNKVVFPDISENPKFAIDLDGNMVDGNCYWMTLKNGFINDYLYLSVIIANSELMQKYHDIKFQNKLYSGKRRYLNQYVSKYPIPSINKPESKKLVKMCKTILNSENPELEFSDMSDDIDELIYSSLKD